MDTEQQGLYFMTAVCSLVSLFAGFLLLAICTLAKLYKYSSIRILSYLTVSNMLGELVLLLPTYRYDFICSFQGHLLNFCIIAQLIFSTLLLHFAYHKIVQNKDFTRIIEIRYLGIALIPALITSLPPFVAENVGNNCWDNKHSPLQDAVGSYGFLVLFSILALISFAYAAAIFVHLDLFPKGFRTEEYVSQLKKFQFVGGFSLWSFVCGVILFVYGCLELIGSEKRSLDFMAMFCYASSGLVVTCLFGWSEKIRRGLRGFLGKKRSVVDIMDEDVERLSSMTEQLSQDLSD